MIYDDTMMVSLYISCNIRETRPRGDRAFAVQDLEERSRFLFQETKERFAKAGLDAQFRITQRITI